MATAPSARVPVPIRRSRTLDERELCPIVQGLIRFGRVCPYPPPCASYRTNPDGSSYCSRTGPACRCALDEPAGAPIWHKARQWHPLPDGSLLYVGSLTVAQIEALLASLAHKNAGSAS